MTLRDRYPRGPYQHNAALGTYLTCLGCIVAALLVVAFLTACGTTPEPQVVYVYVCPSPTARPAQPPPLPTREFTAVPPIPTGVPTAVGTGVPGPVMTVKPTQTVAVPQPEHTRPPLPIPTGVSTRTVP